MNLLVKASRENIERKERLSNVSHKGSDLFDH